MLSRILVLLWLVLPLAAWLANGRLLRNRISPGPLFLGTVLIGYAVLLIAVQCANWELRRNLHRYDLNGDEVFDEEEQTPEMQRAMNAYTHDTGRALAPFTGGPITAIWTGFNFGICTLIGRVVRWFIRPHTGAGDRDR